MKTDSPTAAKAREREWYEMFLRAHKVAEEMVVDTRRGRHRISYYADKLRDFAQSELAATEKRVREECAKALCVYCNNARSWNPETNGKHAYKFGPDERYCDAAAIRSLKLKGE